MAMILPRLFACAAVMVAEAGALTIRTYRAAAHDRFTGTIAAPVKNPNQLFANLDLTGIGWQSNAADAQYALVSRQHVVFATHFSHILVGNQIRFLNSANQLVSRTSPTKVTIMDGADSTDLTLFTLNAPIDAGSGVEPLPYLDLAADALYVGQTIGIAGQGPAANGIQVIGRDTVDAVEPALLVNYGGGTGNLLTKYTTYEYMFKSVSDTSDEGFFEVGDSGSPTFVPANGRAALVGVHSLLESIDGPGPHDGYRNYDVFVPAYIAQLDAQMAPLGYRMRPVNALPTTLTGVVSTLPATPRRLMPLTLQFDLTNSGLNLTGNLEVEFQFPPGQIPASVAGSGWVVYGSGTKWTLRKATLAAAASGTLTATWTTAPALSALTPTIGWRSDTVADQSMSPVINLAPSYAEWSSGLASPGVQADPDQDNVVNLLEYAFGGNPQNGALKDANGGPLLPKLERVGSDAVFSFPERDDKALRGLNYTVWYSTDLDHWTITPPAGASSGTSPQSPVIAGFVRRTISWPESAGMRFARVVVTLAE